MDDLHPPGQSSPDIPIIIQRLDFSHSDLISEVISDYRTSGAETNQTFYDHSTQTFFTFRFNLRSDHRTAGAETSDGSF